MQTNKILAYKERGHRVKIEQTKIQRDWMDDTQNRHAYKCFPVSLVNTIGYSISFLDDIEFIWDGISDTNPDHVKIITCGQNVCNTNRANGTISFNTGLYFKTDENISIISISPPNYFIDGAFAMSSIISTSFYQDSFPVAWKITRPNKNIVIPAGTPVATLIPISISSLSNFEMDLYDKEYNHEDKEKIIEKLNVLRDLSKEGKFSNFYRDAVDHNGNSIGRHEKKSINLKVNDFTEKI